MVPVRLVVELVVPWTISADVALVRAGLLILLVSRLMMRSCPVWELIRLTLVQVVTFETLSVYGVTLKGIWE